MGKARLWAVGLTAAITSLAIGAPAQAASGTWERAWGENVDSVAPGTGFEGCTVITQCQATNPATADLCGDMNQPVGIAVDGAGGVYVADAGLKQIHKSDLSG